MKLKLLQVACLLLLSVWSDWADAAPDLAFSELLQAPEGAKVDWPSLKGKVVVVNFWATWCVPCVAEIPLLNALTASVDPAKVQLIAIDFNGEDRDKIDSFLKKHPISGWIGVDKAREMQKRFDVDTIPVTFLIGPDGTLVRRINNVATLKAEQLTALAEGRVVAFDDTVKADDALLDEQKKQQAEAEKAKIASFMATNGKTLANVDGVMLSEAASALDDGLPADLARTVQWTPGRLDLLSYRLEDMVAYAFGTQATRVVVSGAPLKKRYNLHIDMSGADQSTLQTSVEKALIIGLKIKAQRQTVKRDVLILGATPQATRHLDNGAPPAQRYCIFLPIPPDKMVTCAAGSLDDLAESLEAAQGTPVLDQTGLAGSVTVKLPAAALSNSLGRQLGLTLTKARKPVEMVVVSAAP